MNGRGEEEYFQKKGNKKHEPIIFNKDVFLKIVLETKSIFSTEDPKRIASEWATCLATGMSYNKDAQDK